ncbi:hypothetical protein QJQ45_008698 [Haematococcus lacustris]|nr:hypothetical protein QJQ45_008698 [Haematococcus lacustris]
MSPKRNRKRPVSPAPSAAGASGSGQQVQGQGQAAKVVIGQRRQVIKVGLRGFVKAALPDLSPAQIGGIVSEINKRLTMGRKRCCLTAVLCLSLLLQSFLGQPSPAQPPLEFPTAGPAPGPPPPPDLACPPYAHPRLATCSSPRTAAAPGQLPPPVQLDIWDPQLLAQIKDAMELLAKASVIEHMMRGPHHRGIRQLPGEVAVFEQPSSAWPVAMLKQLDEVHLTGDGNSLNANATTIITIIKEFYRHPGRFINKWAKAVGLEADSLPHWQKFIQYNQLQNSEWDFARRVETDGVSVSVHFPARTYGISRSHVHHLLLLTSFLSHPTPFFTSIFTSTSFSTSTSIFHYTSTSFFHYTSTSFFTSTSIFTSTSFQLFGFLPLEVGLYPSKPCLLSVTTTTTSDFSAATHIAVKVDPGVIKAIKAAHARRHPVTGQVLRQWEWELSKGQPKHDSGLTNAKQDTARWSTAIQPQLQQLAAATAAGTTLDSLLA